MTPRPPGATRLVIACDGGARGNPGPAGIGCSITTPGGREVATIAEAIGIATNNVAEYTAVLRGLRRAKELGASHVAVRSDSKLLVEQLNGNYRVKNPTLQRLHAEVRAAAREIGTVTYEHVRRERNKRADELVNEAIDLWEGTHPGERSTAEPSQDALFE